MAWTPLLEGQLAAGARHAIRDIAIDVATAPAPAASPADRTLFWAYATRFVDERFAHAAYDSAMDDLVATLQEGVTHASLYDGGLAGIGWTLVHVLDGGGEDVLEVIDEAIGDLLAVDRWSAANDLAQGLVGYGVYFAERIAVNPNAQLAHRGLARVIGHLERNAVRTDEGTTWLTSIDVMPERYRTRYPGGFHDCGVAHGTPGVIAFLARAAAVAGDDHARSLCGDALHWLSARRHVANPGGWFPSIVPPREFARGSQVSLAPTRDATRTAWCYGDPGVAAALWSASPDLARETALAAAQRDPSTSGVRDACVCHGAAGLAHLYNRFYQATGEPTLRDAATEWFARTLAMQHPASHGLLEGSIGIALALLAALGGGTPSWDRMLLCDLAEVT